MKLEDIRGEQTKTKSMKASEETFKRLKVVGAHTQRTQNQVLRDLLREECNRLNITI